MKPTATLDLLFTYHPPTPETTPRYTAVRAAEKKCRDAEIRFGTVAGYAEVNALTKDFAQVIEDNAPPGADRTTAIRCVRRARMAMNEMVAIFSSYPPDTDVCAILEQRGDEIEALRVVAQTAFTEARWWACSAIALAGVA